MAAPIRPALTPQSINTRGSYGVLDLGAANMAELARELKISASDADRIAQSAILKLKQVTERTGNGDGRVIRSGGRSVAALSSTNAADIAHIANTVLSYVQDTIYGNSNPASKLVDQTQNTDAVIKKVFGLTIGSRPKGMRGVNLAPFDNAPQTYSKLLQKIDIMSNGSYHVNKETNEIEYAATAGMHGPGSVVKGKQRILGNALRDNGAIMKGFYAEAEAERTANEDAEIARDDALHQKALNYSISDAGINGAPAVTARRLKEAENNRIVWENQRKIYSDKNSAFYGTPEAKDFFRRDRNRKDRINMRGSGRFGHLLRGAGISSKVAGNVGRVFGAVGSAGLIVSSVVGVGKLLYGILDKMFGTLQKMSSARFDSSNRAAGLSLSTASLQQITRVDEALGTDFVGSITRTKERFGNIITDTSSVTELIARAGIFAPSGSEQEGIINRIIGHTTGAPGSKDAYGIADDMMGLALKQSLRGSTVLGQGGRFGSSIEAFQTNRAMTDTFGGSETIERMLQIIDKMSIPNQQAILSAIEKGGFQGGFEEFARKTGVDPEIIKMLTPTSKVFALDAANKAITDAAESWKTKVGLMGDYFTLDTNGPVMQFKRAINWIFEELTILAKLPGMARNRYAEYTSNARANDDYVRELNTGIAATRYDIQSVIDPTGEKRKRDPEFVTKEVQRVVEAWNRGDTRAGGYTEQDTLDIIMGSELLADMLEAREKTTTEIKENVRNQDNMGNKLGNVDMLAEKVRQRIERDIPERMESAREYRSGDIRYIMPNDEGTADERTASDVLAQIAQANVILKNPSTTREVRQNTLDAMRGREGVREVDGLFRAVPFTRGEETLMYSASRPDVPSARVSEEDFNTAVLKYYEMLDLSAANAVGAARDLLASLGPLYKEIYDHGDYRSDDGTRRFVLDMRKTGGPDGDFVVVVKDSKTGETIDRAAWDFYVNERGEYLESLKSPEDR